MTEEKAAVGIEDGERRDAAIEGHIVFLGDVEIFVLLSDVDVDHEKGFVEGGSDFRAVEGLVENMAVRAPVAAKNNENSFVRSGGGVESFADFLAGVDAGRIEIFAYQRLTEASGGGTLRDTEEPLVVLVEPSLGHGDILFFEGGAVLEGEGEFEHEHVEVRLRILFLGDLCGEIGEAVGFPGRPEGEFVEERNLYVVRANGLWAGGLAVESGKSGDISGENGATPFFEGREGGSESGLARGSGNGQEKSKQGKG